MNQLPSDDVLRRQIDRELNPQLQRQIMQRQEGHKAAAHKTNKQKREKDYSRAPGGKWLEDALLEDLTTEINNRLSSEGLRTRADGGLTLAFPPTLLPACASFSAHLLADPGQ